MNKMYFRRDSDKLIAEKAQVIHVSMGYRYWWNSYLASSVALYTSYPMGDSEILYNDFTATDGNIGDGRRKF